jgi:hypothetical protein
MVNAAILQFEGKEVDRNYNFEPETTIFMPILEDRIALCPYTHWV